MKRVLILAALALAGLLAPARAFAWDDLGHRVVARIAWENMTLQARANAVALLRAAPEESGLPLLWRQGMWPDSIRDREFFVQAASWADVVRDRDFVGNSFHRPPWHYVNYFWRQQRTGGPALPSDHAPVGEMVARLTELSGAITSPSLPQAERGVDLAWVLHLAGDIHQPMHASARISPETPEGDRGANDFPLGPDRGDNLHSFWDQAITRSYRWGAETPGEYMGRIARTAMSATPRPAGDAALKAGQYEAWARESFDVAKTLYPASLHRGSPAPSAYDRASARVATTRVAMAGYRLADLLNRALGS